VLTYLTELKITTEAGRVVVHARGGIPPASKASM
jgi:hypothetical protein